MSETTTRYEIASEQGLWAPVLITVDKNGTIIESSVKGACEIGASFASMKKYWEQFDGENKYLINKL